MSTVIEFQEILPQVLRERELCFEDVMRDQETARWLSVAMPSTQVAVELKSAWHRNRYKTWTNNDVYDIDALAVAVPYCDIVVTEKACHHVLSSAVLTGRCRPLFYASWKIFPALCKHRYRRGTRLVPPSTSLLLAG